MSIIAAFVTQTGVLLAGESICEDMSGGRMAAMKKVHATGLRSAAAVLGCMGWRFTDGSSLDAKACVTVQCEELRRDQTSIADQAVRVAAGIARANDGRRPDRQMSEYFATAAEVLLIMTGGLDASRAAVLGLARVRYDEGGARFISEVQPGPALRMRIVWPARTPLALVRLHSMLSEIDDPGVQTVMAVVKRRPDAPLPTTDAARIFFGHLVETAIELMPDADFIPAAWPVNAVEISQSGISEQRYDTLDEIQASLFTGFGKDADVGKSQVTRPLPLESRPGRHRGGALPR